MREYKTCGIILRSRVQGETDRIVTVLSADLGLFDAKIRGALKPKSKLGPPCQQFCTVELTLAPGKVVDTITESSLVRSSSSMEEDLYSVAYASLIAEITLKMTDERHPDSRAYKLLESVIGAMMDGLDPKLAACSFMMKRAYIDGILPVLTRCSECGAQDELGWFSPETGGAMCTSCASIAIGSTRFSEEARKLAISLYKSTWPEIAGLVVDPSEIDELYAALLEFVCFRGDIRLRSAETIAMMGDLKSLVRRER